MTSTRFPRLNESAAGVTALLMNLQVISVTMVLLGACFMAAAIAASKKTYGELPPEKITRWRTITGLMCFFLFGYGLFIVNQLFDYAFPLELLTSVVFLAGAFFVFVMIRLAGETIREVNHAAAQLRQLNRELRRGNQVLTEEVTARTKAEEELRQAQEHLEELVKVRTRELMETMDNLRREVDERQRAESAIARSHAELNQIFNTATDGMRIIDREFRVIRTNETFRALVQQSGMEDASRKCFEIFPGSACHTADCPVIRIMNGAERVESEVAKQRADGSEITCILTATPYRSPEGELLGVIETFQDISKRKEIEKDLRRAFEESRQLTEQLERQHAALQGQNAKLEEAYAELKNAQAQILQQEKMASIGQLAAGVAHEINNPIGFITSNLGTLSKYLGRLEEFIGTQGEALGNLQALALVAEARNKLKIDYVLTDTRDLISESLDGAERVKEIVQNLKNFSRIDQAEEQPADLNECLETTISIIWNELKYKATVQKEYGDLPRIMCYPHQLNQVFMNLLVNAVQAIDKKGEITIRTWAENGTVRCAIHDSGCGIPADKLKRIFEPFFTTKPVGKGTGLGLSICYDIIEKHAGEILVESSEGHGTTFTVELPIKQGANADGKSVTSQS